MPAPRNLNVFLVATATAALGACSGYNLEAGRDPEPVAQPAPAPATDPCADAPERVADVSDRDAAARGLACGAESLVPFEEAVAVFDDWDELVVAAAVIRCAESDACNVDRPAGLGLFGFAAEELAASSSVAERLGLAGAAAEAFVERLEAAQDVLAERVSDLDATRREIYVELPRMVHDEVALIASSFPEHAERFAALIGDSREQIGAGASQASTVAELRDLRAGFVTDCYERSGLTMLECLGGPIARPVTEHLLHHAMLADDGPSARAEFELLGVTEDRSTFMAALWRRQDEQRTAASADHAAAMAAVDEGADPADVTELYGETVDAAADPALPWSPTPLGVSADDLVDTAEFIVGQVEDIEADGDGAEVEFHRVYIDPDDFDCDEGPEFRVFWGERRVQMDDCGDFDRQRLRPDPVRFGAEYHVLSAGVVVEAWTDGDDNARIVRVFPGEHATTPSVIGGFAIGE